MLGEDEELGGLIEDYNTTPSSKASDKAASAKVKKETKHKLMNV